MIFTDTSMPLQEIGTLRIVPSTEIKASGISLGMECLDRMMYDFEQAYKKMGAIGIKWARCQTGWSRCETCKGIYDFAWLDNVVNKLLSVGVQPWFNVSYGNKLYMPDAYGEAAVGFVPLYYGDEVIQAWKNYVRALAVHFSGRVKRWEIWNEPDLSNFWQPKKADPIEYARLIRITAPMIRSAIPDAEIGACSSALFRSDYFPAFAGTGIGRDIQFYCFHNYSIQPERDIKVAVETIRRIFAKNGGEHVEIYQGEGGYASHFPKDHWMGTYIMDSEENQAKWLLRRYATDFGNGLKMSSFFQAVDMMGKSYQKGDESITDPARHGLLNGLTYTPKKSYYAMAHEAAVFDADTVLTPLYSSVNTYTAVPRNTQVSRVFDLAIVQHTFIRKGYPLFLYYLPEDVQHSFSGIKNIQLCLLPYETPNILKKPVLLDMLTGKVYRTEITDRNQNAIVNINGLPLTDYPLVLTDYAAIEDRIAHCPE